MQPFLRLVPPPQSPPFFVVSSFLIKSIHYPHPLFRQFKRNQIRHVDRKNEREGKREREREREREDRKGKETKANEAAGKGREYEMRVDVIPQPRTICFHYARGVNGHPGVEEANNLVWLLAFPSPSWREEEKNFFNWRKKERVWEKRPFSLGLFEKVGLGTKNEDVAIVRECCLREMYRLFATESFGKIQKDVVNLYRRSILQKCIDSFNFESCFNSVIVRDRASSSNVLRGDLKL